MDSRLQRLIGSCILIGLGLWLCADLDRYVDIEIGDELGYLSIGKDMHFFASRILYPLWYKFLGLFAADPINLFYLNQEVLTIALPVCLFLLLYETLRNFPFSLLAACLFLYANSNVAAEFIYYGKLLAVVYNKINQFTLCLICLLGIALIRLQKAGWSLVALLAWAFLILSYCRNEYGLIYLVLIPVYIFVFLSKLRHIRRERYLFFAFLATALATYYVFGFSALASGHSNVHYIMSYSRNYLERHHEILNADVDFLSPCLNVFGHQQSLFQFFLANPSAFIDNIFYNVYNMSVINSFQLSDIIIPQVFLPYTDQSVFNYALSGLILMLIIAGAYFLVTDKVYKTPSIKIFLIYFSLLFFTNLLSNTIFYYDPRYFVYFAPGIYLVLAQLSRRYEGATGVVAGIAIGAILLCSPNYKTYTQRNQYTAIRPNLEYIGYMRNYLAERRLTQARLLTNTGSLDILLPGVRTDDFNRLNMFLDPNPESRFRDLESYDIILVKKVKGPQSYLWYNRVQDYLQKHEKEFAHRYDDFGMFSYHLYLKK